MRKRNGTTIVMVLAVLLTVALLVGACSKPAPSPTPSPSVPKPPPSTTAASPSPSPTAKTTASPYGWSKPISIGAVTLKGTYYPCAAGWAELAKKYFGISMTPEITGGSAANVKLLESGQIEIGYVSPDAGYDAVRGIGDYAGKKVPMRAMLRGHGMMFHLFALAKSGIKTPADMNGRTWMYYMKGSPANISFGEALKEFYKLDKVKPLTMAGTEDAVYAVADGSAEVGQVMSYGSPAMVETCLTKDIVFLPLSPEAIKYICNKLQWLEPMPIPKGTYKGVDRDVPTVGYNVSLYCMENLPEDLVYMMVRSILDHTDEFAKYHERAKEWTLENTLTSPVAPFHSGAIRYFKEKGVWTPKMEELQKKLLADVGATK